MKFTCKRCGHEWLTRLENRKPVCCPGCKSPYWNKPKGINCPDCNKVIPQPKKYLRNAEGEPWVKCPNCKSKWSLIEEQKRSGVVVLRIGLKL